MRVKRGLLRAENGFIIESTSLNSLTSLSSYSRINQISSKAVEYTQQE